MSNLAQLTISKNIATVTLNRPEKRNSITPKMMTELDSIFGNKIHFLFLVEKNPAALVASFQVSENIEPNFSTRIKMSQTSDVFAVAILSDGKALFSKKEVKVTIGGCGN